MNIPLPAFVFVFFFLFSSLINSSAGIQCYDCDDISFTADCPGASQVNYGNKSDVSEENFGPGREKARAPSARCRISFFIPAYAMIPRTMEPMNID